MTKTVIAIDAMGIENPGGARTAVYYPLLKVFQARPGWEFHVFLSREEPGYCAYPNVKQIIIPLKQGPLVRLLAQVIFPFYALVKHVSLFHYAKSQGAVVFGARMTLTLFDATILIHPEMYSTFSVFYWRHIQPWMVRKMDHVIIISNNAADDLKVRLQIPAEKISVVYCAGQFEAGYQSPPGLYEDLRSRHRLPERYLLFVGILALKKNLPTLIRALGLLKDEGIPTPPLVIAGARYGRSDAGEIFNLINELGLQNEVLYIGPVETQELPALYEHAEALLIPSVHEGFGIPAIEAMACRTPVIASKASSLPEVIGEAGLLVEDYLSPQAWAESIRELLTDDEAYQRLKIKGFERARLFTWERFAGQFLSILEETLQKHPSGN
jgi:glycosyltransferase involved in cell wall biosynthesis